ncbi:hypothetical protein JCGZ_05545 [Jatropha curcas]|uniref:FAS1 domain-containing protein n=1 Tax=Jatropha curcas TaxID=180498 RepID=A0A067LA09_JATCU|nr:fasciclin-like arabinogalactan protein 12 [Jatropha curcas]KDP44078.1 hypothetical protein JCGZ_05545 [Jatropha curcas]
MKQQTLFSFSLVLLCFYCTKTLAQSPAAAPAPATKPPATKPPAKAKPSPPPPTPPAATAPAPALVPVQPSKGPLNVVKVLQKAGHFTFFVRLIKTTQEDIQLFSQLNASTDGVTIFAPYDAAFSSIIKSGTLNSLSDQEKRELVQFHIIPRFLSTSQFQTVSNPLKSLAGASSRLALNVTTSDNLVNVSTGLTKTYVSAIVYTDGKVAIYQVDKVLLPIDLFAPKPPAPAPAPTKATKEDSTAAESPVVPKDNTSGAMKFIVHDSLVILGVIGMASAIFL